MYDIVAMWLPSEGVHVGHIIRIIRSPSLQSHYPVFEWRTDAKANEKITMCVRVLDFQKKKRKTNGSCQLLTISNGAV